MLSIIAIIAILGAVALGPLALRFGVDTRPGFDERPEPQQHRTNL